MRYFLIGLALAYGGAVAVVQFTIRRVLAWDDPASYQAGVLLAGVLPFAASWLVADLLDRLRPRLVFDHRTRRPIVTLIAGVLAGVLGVVLGAAAIMLAQPWVDEGVLLAVGGATAPIPVVLSMRRRRARGSCLACGYDLSASHGLCPECGAVASRA